MTFKLFGKYLTFNLRNGVGLDLEFADSRPVWVTSKGSEALEVFCFEGAVILLPFTCITFGECYHSEQ
jgi:hypothetical protein